MIIELSPEQIRNIRAFLGRVDLKGNEAVALVSIFQALASQKPVRVEPKDVKKKKHLTKKTKK